MTRAQISFQMAHREVMVELDDDQMSSELSSRLKGFALHRIEDPWLLARVRHGRPEPETERRLELIPSPAGAYRFDGSKLAGELTLGSPHRLTVTVDEVGTLSQALQLCFSLLLPREGAMMVHADAVTWRDGALAFLGPSGAGKSTAAQQLVEGSGSRWLTNDRTILELDVSRRPLVHTIAPLGRKVPEVIRPLSLPLIGLLFPRRSDNLGLSPVSDLEALTRLLQGIIFPPGHGQPVGEALDVAEGVLEGVLAAELRYWQGQDFSNFLANTSNQAGESR